VMRVGGEGEKEFLGNWTLSDILFGRRYDQETGVKRRSMKMRGKGV